MRLLLIVVLLFSWAASASNTIRVAKEQRTLYARDHYLYALLDQALKAANYHAEIEHVSVHPHQQRTLLALSSGKVDLHWSMTSPEREQLAIAVKVPLFKGLIGKRALLVKAEQMKRFTALKTKADFKDLTAIQGHDWPDTKVLSFNQLTVKPMAKYSAMFALLQAGRVDYFPRSVIEVQAELESQSGNFAIVPTVYFSYPSAFYFFVSKERVELAKALHLGLEKMQKTGEFDVLFAQYFAKQLKGLLSDSAVEIKLENPYFRH